VFDTWLRSVDSYSGDDFGYLNPKGVIPPSAVVKRDTKRNSGKKGDGKRVAAAEGTGIADSDD